MSATGVGSTKMRGEQSSARAQEVDAAIRRFRPDVQGMRAIAVLLVLLYHAGVPLITGGYVGVDVFFVISGFLITSHLVSMIEKSGRIQFADFYARRIRRILPAALVVVVLTVIAVLLFYPVVQAPVALRDAIATVLYVPNFWFALQDTDYLASSAPSPFQHYWSLGIEEQFYLLWPLILVAVFFFVKTRARIAAVISALLLASLIGGVFLTPVNQPYAFFMLPTRAWELMAGGLVALALPLLYGRVPAVVRVLLGWAGLGIILASAFLYNSDTAFPGWVALAPVAGSAAILIAGFEPARGGVHTLLSIRPAQHIGKISYALYLAHWPLLIAPQAASGFVSELPLPLSLLLGLPVAYVAALALHHFVEEPCRAPKALTSRRPRVTLWIALGTTVVLSIVLLVAVQWSDRRQTPTGDPVAQLTTPSPPSEGTSHLPANLRPTLENAADDLPEVYADKCQLNQREEELQSLETCLYGPKDAPIRIAVFGDSHSAQWFPAVHTLLGERNDVSIEVYTKSFCPAITATPEVGGQPYESCARWREKALRQLTDNPAKLVIFSNSAGAKLEGAATAAEKRDLWRDGTTEVVGKLRAAGSKVLNIADIPEFSEAPAVCVGANPDNVEECAGARSSVLDTKLAEVEAKAVREAGGEVLDLTDLFCNDSTCPVIIDDVFVYRDRNHLSATMADALGEPVRERINEVLAR